MRVVQTAARVQEPRLPDGGVLRGAYGLPVGTLWAKNPFSNTPAAHVRLAHVDQGYLNDCFLNAVMGALALKQPERIERMLTYHADHVDVRFPDEVVHIGRELPMLDGRPMYSGSGGNGVLWPSYIEKAVASRLPEGYASLDRGGDVRQAFRWLTGARPHKLAPPTGSIVADIRARLGDGQAVVVGTYRTPSTSMRGREMSALGLYADHAYVAQSVFSKDGVPQLRLWNVWGNSHPMTLNEDQVRRLVSEVVTDRSWYFVPDALAYGGSSSVINGQPGPVGPMA